MIVWLVPKQLFSFCFVERCQYFIFFREANYDKISFGYFLEGSSMLNALFAKSPEIKIIIGNFAFQRPTIWWRNMNYKLIALKK